MNSLTMLLTWCVCLPGLFIGLAACGMAYVSDFFRWLSKQLLSISETTCILGFELFGLDASPFKQKETK